MKSITLASLAAAIAAVSPVNAFWRLGCRGTAGTARIDPLMNFGEISDHVHYIHGGDSKSSFSSISDITTLLPSVKDRNLPIIITAHDTDKNHDIFYRTQHYYLYPVLGIYYLIP